MAREHPFTGPAVRAVEPAVDGEDLQPAWPSPGCVQVPGCAGQNPVDNRPERW
jgi:hypothetical protein